MADADFSKITKKLRKKIACISGHKATKLAQKLDKIEKNGKSDNHICAEDDKRQSAINHQQKKRLGKIDKEANKYFIFWMLILFVATGIVLLSFIIYFRGYITHLPIETKIDCNDVYVIINHPYALELDKSLTIRCDATRENSDYQGKVLIEFVRDERFGFKDDVYHHVFDYSEPLSPSFMTWNTEIKYNHTYSWAEHLIFLIDRKHIDVGIKNKKGEYSSRKCISFQIISFYSKLVNIFLIIVSLIGVIISFLKLSKIFTILIEIFLLYLKNRIKNN